MKNTEWKERLSYVVKHYFNEMLENGENPAHEDWISAYDCFCGCYGEELTFDENEAQQIAEKIWRDLIFPIDK